MKTISVLALRINRSIMSYDVFNMKTTHKSGRRLMAILSETYRNTPLNKILLRGTFCCSHVLE